MSDPTALVSIDRSRLAITGIELPTPPPARIYISGHMYRIAAPTVALPPLINTVKCILNWASSAGRVARNIFYLKTSGGFVTSDPVGLREVADAIQAFLFSGTTLPGLISSYWTLTSTTVKDNAGTTAQASSTAAPIPGTNAGQPMPPQVSVCVSWQIAESYRGGKPRWYLPGIPSTAALTAGSSQLSSSYATSLEGAATNFMTHVNSMLVAAPGSFTLGTVSYYAGHAVRTTPQFRTFINAKVHERFDSQRRRSGPESAFPVIP